MIIYPLQLYFGCCLQSISFLSFAFNPFVSLNLKCISYRQHMLARALFIQADTLCLLIGLFNPFRPHVILGVTSVICFFVSIMSFIVIFYIK